MKREEWFGAVLALGVCLLVYGRLMQYGIIQGILLAVVFALVVGYFKPSLRKRAILFGLFFPTCGVIGGPLLVLVDALAGPRRDALLSSLDGGRSILIFHWFLLHPFLWKLFDWVYDALSVFIAVAFLFGDWKPLLRTCIGSTLGAFVIFALCPAVGPALVSDPKAAPNCIPSMHVGIALLCMVFLHGKWRWAGLIFCILTAISTISTGEHYIIDVVAAVPYILLVVAVDKAFSRRRTIVLQEQAQEA